MTTVPTSSQSPRREPVMSVVRSTLAMLAILTSTTWAAGAWADDRPADSLLALLPADAGLTLTIENLREHANAVLSSPLADRLMALPAAREWLGSDGGRRLRAARREIETATGLTLAEIRDDLAGDAAVLAMYLPRGADVGDARGILLLRPRDPERLTRLIHAVNRADARIIERLDVRPYRGVSLISRVFRAGAKPNEWYAVLDGGLFAWSNSEALVRSVIDRRDDPSLPNLRRLATFDRVRRSLPERACLGLYAEARFLERQMATAQAPPGSGRGIGRLIRSYLHAVDYAGLALEWSPEGPRLTIHQEIGADRLSAPMRAWANRAGSTEPLLRGLPDDPLAVVAGHLHLPAVLGALKTAISTGDSPRLDEFAGAIAEVAPERLEGLLESIGPAWALGIHAPGPGNGSASWVLATSLGADLNEESRQSLDRLLRSALALDAIRPGPAGGPEPIVDERLDGRSISRRAVGRPLAYGRIEDRAAVGSSPEALVSYLNGRAGSGGGSSFQEVRAARFADAASFAYVDPARLRGVLNDRRAGILQWIGRPDAGHDLDQVIGLLGLFQSAYATSRIAPGFQAIDQTLVLVPAP